MTTVTGRSWWLVISCLHRQLCPISVLAINPFHPKAKSWVLTRQCRINPQQMDCHDTNIWPINKASGAFVGPTQMPWVAEGAAKHSIMVPGLVMKWEIQEIKWIDQNDSCLTTFTTTVREHHGEAGSSIVTACKERHNVQKVPRLDGGPMVWNKRQYKLTEWELPASTGLATLCGLANQFGEMLYQSVIHW